MATTTSTTHEQGSVAEPHITPSPPSPPNYEEKTYDQKNYDEKVTDKSSANMTIDRKDTSRDREIPLEGTASGLGSEQQEEERISPTRRYLNKYMIVIHFAFW